MGPLKKSEYFSPVWPVETALPYEQPELVCAECRNHEFKHTGGSRLARPTDVNTSSFSLLRAAPDWHTGQWLAVSLYSVFWGCRFCPSTPPSSGPFLPLPGRINTAPHPHSTVALDGQLISASFVLWQTWTLCPLWCFHHAAHSYAARRMTIKWRRQQASADPASHPILFIASKQVSCCATPPALLYDVVISAYP